MNKKEWLLQQLKGKIEVFKVDSTKHKRLHRQLRYSVFVLSALSSVLAGVGLKLPDWNPTISLAIVLVSAIVGIITSIEGVRKPAELWIHERAAYLALLDLEREVGFRLNEKSSDEQFDEHFDKMQQILTASRAKWLQQVAGGPGKNDSNGGNNPAVT